MQIKVEWVNEEADDKCTQKLALPEEEFGARLSEVNLVRTFMTAEKTDQPS